MKDFADGIDLLDFTAHGGVASLADLTVQSSGSDTRIALAAGGADQIILAGVTDTDIDGSDFIF
ncbi:MAG: hypothetical protein AAGA06_09815 [Pseudomonadota bacterium]